MNSVYGGIERERLMHWVRWVKAKEGQRERVKPEGWMLRLEPGDGTVSDGTWEGGRGRAGRSLET